MVNEAKAWLAGNRDYFAGVAILKESGLTGFTMNMLAGGPDMINTPMLIEELKKVAAKKLPEEPEIMAPVEPVIAQTPLKVDVYNYHKDKNLEKKLQKDKQIRELFKEITHLHGQLAVLPEGDQLYQCANTLLIKNMQKQRLWDELRYFNENGQWFDELPENQPKPFDLEKAIKNARSNRAKAKARLKDPLNKAKREYYEGLVRDWDAKLEKLESQRNA